MFDTIIPRKNSGCFKHDGLNMTYGRDDIIPLWVADMDFAVAPEIIKALECRLKHPIFGYNLIKDDFYGAAIKWQQERHDFDIAKGNIIAVPSLMTALAITVLTQTKIDDHILIQTPVYPPFFTQVTGHKRRLLTNELINNDGYYEIDWTDFEEKAKQAKMFILCNPHNPVGRVFTIDEVSRMNEICAKYDVIIFSDEIHADLTYEPHKHFPIGKLGYERVITGISPAKSFNLAGMATGVMHTLDDDIATELNAMNRGLHTFMGNSFGLAAFTAAFGESGEWHAELMDYLKANCDFLVDFVQREIPQIKVRACEGTYLAWLNCSALGMEDEEMNRFFVDKARVALNPGTNFGQEGSGFMRLNFATQRSVLEEGLERIKNSIREIM